VRILTSPGLPNFRLRRALRRQVLADLMESNQLRRQPRSDVLTPTPDLCAIKLDDLRTAANLYLARAYPSGQAPDAVRRRLQWPPDVGPEALLAKAPFERASKPGDPPIFALRLGNSRYPHMKLQIQPWPCTAGYMLSVNTHDQVLNLDPNAADIEAFRVLQAENLRLKETIEQDWDHAGLPTFLRYLRDYLESNAGDV
jgi:hypothetical protein